MDENLDEAAIRELEEVLHTKIYPGTEIMKDVGTHHFVKSTEAKKRGGQSSSVLVPQPSDAADDPLNWSPLWKGAAIFAATLLSFSLNLGPLALAPMFESYVAEWDRSLADVVQFTGVAILVLGFSNFVWVPIMVCWGRRPVAIASSLICVCSSIWRARATSYNSFMGASVLNGLAAGPCETLAPQVIADIIFLHERGKYQTLYFSIYFISLMVGPIISGAMDFNTGWRSFWWFNTALLIFACLSQVFFLPETRYRREVPANPGQASATAEGSGAAASGTDPGEAAAANAKRVEAEEEEQPTATTREEAEKGNVSEDAETGLRREPTHVDPSLGRGRPTRRQFALWQPYEGSILRELWVPLYLHAFPIVEFAAFVVSWSASGFLVVNLSQTQAFAAPPYNYSSQTIGLFNLAVLVGAMVGLLTCGPLSDGVAAYLTRRNNGVREPEMRLVAMAPYIVVMIIGSVVTAVGYDAGWPWQAIVIVGYSLLGLQVAALPSIASTYAIDSYKPATGSMFVTITVNKNVWGYGVSKFITPWAASSGFKAPILTNMALITLWSCSAVIFWFWGKRFRGITKDSIVHRP